MPSRTIRCLIVALSTIMLFAGCSVGASDKDYKLQLDYLLDEWDDATALANVTARVSLSGPIAELQVIRRRASRLEPSPRFAVSHNLLIEYMDSVIEALVDFAAGRPAGMTEYRWELRQILMISKTKDARESWLGAYTEALKAP